MRALLIQRSDTYKFLDDFAQAFAERGHEARVVPYAQTNLIPAHVATWKPDFVLCIGSSRWVPLLVDGQCPVVIYELDRSNNPHFFRDVPIRPRDIAFTTYKEDVETFRRFGFAHVHYLPFCPNVRRHTLDAPSYLYDVTFAGSIVRRTANEYQTFVSQVRDLMQRHPDAAPRLAATLEALEKILASQERASTEGRYVLPELVAETVARSGFNWPAEDLATVMAKEASSRQRESWLRGVPQLTVFGDDDWAGVLPDAKFGGAVDQYTGSSELFYRSRININLQRIYARGGLSDRVFNVLYSEGFLLADRNEALLELFDDGKEVVTYASTDELIDRARYYLAHDAEREAIARRGYERVMREHLFSHRLETIVKLVAQP